MKTDSNWTWLALSTAALVCAACSQSSGGSAASTAMTSARLHVSATAAAGGGGASWSDALTDLALAIDLARPGDQIWIAAGMYRPAPPNGDRLASFHLKSGVEIHGGFAGHETALDERELGAHVTTLSGDLNGDDGSYFENTAENSIHVVVALDVDAHALLDEVTVRGGRADGPGFGATIDSQDQGAGVDIFGGAPRFQRCMFQGNWTRDHGAVNDHGDATSFVDCMWCTNHAEVQGGGLFVGEHARTSVIGGFFLSNSAVNEGGGANCRSRDGASFIDCIWTANRAVSGAAMFHSEGTNARVAGSEFRGNNAGNGGGGIFCDRSATIVENCLFEDNSAGLAVITGGGGGGGSGGAGIWSTGGSPLIARCVFRRNQASFGAGVYHIEESAALVIDCDFEDNHAGEGGGLYTLSSPSRTIGCRFVRNSATGTSFSVGGGMSNYFSTSIVQDCLFRQNRAQLGGGGMYCEGENPRFVNLRFEGNEATGPEQGFGGGLLNGYHTLSVVVNCTFALNKAKSGGAIHDMFASAGTMVNCTMAGNISGHGGGVFCNEDSTPRYLNCIVWGNTAEDHFGAPFECVFGCTSNLSRAWMGALSLDPRLVRMPSLGNDAAWGTDDDDFGDLRLAGDSPCIDAGTNRALPADITLDCDGALRVRDEPLAPNTGMGQGAVVDMGAFERP